MKTALSGWAPRLRLVFATPAPRLRLLALCPATSEVAATSALMTPAAFRRFKGEVAYWCPSCRVGHAAAAAALWLDEPAASADPLPPLSRPAARRRRARSTLPSRKAVVNGGGRDRRLPLRDGDLV